MINFKKRSGGNKVQPKFTPLMGVLNFMSGTNLLESDLVEGQTLFRRMVTLN